MCRERLPQLDGGLFITDGGIETALIFHHGLELPAFAAFDLLKDERGTEELRRYYAPYAELARDHGVGLVLEPDLARQPGLGGGDRVLARRAGRVQREGDHPDGGAPRRVRVGPTDRDQRLRDLERGWPTTTLTSDEAERYHSTQIATFADTAADMVTAITMTYAEEAIGLTRAAVEHGLPVALCSRPDRRPVAERPGARRSNPAG